MNKYISVQAYKERCRNFDLLKNGLIKKYVDNALDLEDRQEQSLFKITDTPKDDYSLSSGYFHACTAFGKSYLIKAMAEGYFAEEKNKKIIILEENVSVLKQIKKDLLVNSSFSEDDIGTYFGDEKYPQSPILVTTYASMERMLKEVKKENIGLVLCDEAHHILSQRRQQIAKEFDHAGLYGFTATPHYNTDKDCSLVFGNIIDSVTIRKGVESDLLCSFKNGLFVSHIPLDITEAKTSSGEYDPTKLAQIMRASHVQGMREELADFYLKSTDKEVGRLYGKTTLINVPSQEEADKLAETFNQKAGRTIAKSYHTNTDEEPLKEFQQGLFPVLVQVNRLSEGYNNKNVEICINYPTGSKVRSAQRSGRALRRNSDKQDKLALVVDIAFKRRQSGDVLQEIHDNGQVLFMDVAEEGAIYSEAYRRQHPEIDLISIPTPDIKNDPDEKKNSQKTQFLFDVITDYRDIYKLIYRHLELQEMRVKQPYDLIKYDFTARFDIFKNGQKLSYSQREKLFDELVRNPKFIKEHIAKQVLSSGKTFFVIDARRISDIAKELNLGFVYRNVKELPLKLKTDIMKEDFVLNFNVFDNGNEISPKMKRIFFDKLCDNEELINHNLIHLVRSRNQQAYAIDGLRLTEFMTISGIKIEQKTDIPQKSNTDIGMEDFARHYNVMENGNTLTKDEKYARYKELVQNEELIRMGIIKTVMAKNLTLQVIDGTRLNELLHLTGIELKEKIQSRQIRQDDITRADFIRADYTITQNGKQLVYKDKVLLIAKLFADMNLQERNIVVPVKDNGKFSLVINSNKLAELFELTGIKIEKRDYLEEKQTSDISLTYFRTNYCVLINGKELNFDEKSDFFGKFCANDDYVRAGYIKNVHRNGHPVLVIDGTKLEEIKKHTGIIIKEKNTLEKLSQYDLNQENFCRNFIVVINNQPISNRELRAELFKQLIREPQLIEAGIVKNVSPGTLVIDSSRLGEIQKLTGITVTKRKKLPQKVASDIIKTEFLDNFALQKDGKILDKKQSEEIFNQLIARKDELNGIIKLVQATSIICYVIDGQKLDELSKLTGLVIKQKEYDALEQKKETDIIPTYLAKNYKITVDGQVLSVKQKRSWIATIMQNEELISSGVVKKVKTGPSIATVIDGLQLDKLSLLTGYNLVPLTEVEKRKETDISGNDFIREYEVIENGKTLSVLEKKKLFPLLLKDEELKENGIVKSIQTHHFDVIDGEKLEELLRLRGISVSKRKTYPKQKDSDITLSNFQHDFKIIQNGVVISRDHKKELFDEICADKRLLERHLVRMVQSPYTTVMMIDGTRLKEFEEITGISIQQPSVLPQRENTDIVQSDFVTRYSVTQNGHILNKEDRSALFDALVENENLIEQGIIKAVKSQRHELKVIDGKKLKELQKIIGLQIITPQQKLYDLQDKIDHAKNDAERNKYQYQLQSMFKALKKRHISIQMPDKSKDK